MPLYLETAHTGPESCSSYGCRDRMISRINNSLILQLRDPRPGRWETGSDPKASVLTHPQSGVLISHLSRYTCWALILKLTNPMSVVFFSHWNVFLKFHNLYLLKGNQDYFLLKMRKWQNNISLCAVMCSGDVRIWSCVSVCTCVHSYVHTEREASGGQRQHRRNLVEPGNICY